MAADNPKNPIKIFKAMPLKSFARIIKYPTKRTRQTISKAFFMISIEIAPMQKPSKRA